LQPANGSDGLSPRAGGRRFPLPSTPEVRFCTTADGVRIAYSPVGSGPVLVRVLGWFTHLDMEWEWPALRLLWERLAEYRTVVRYDGRGIGLSDHWAGEFTEETRQLDLDAVLTAVGATRINLFGVSEGGWTACLYALKYPERVARLILYGAYLRGRAADPSFDEELGQAMLTLVRKGWGKDTHIFRQVFTSNYFGPDAEPGLVAHFNQLQRVSADPDTAVRYIQGLRHRGDASQLFGQIRTPTLVLHCRDDQVVEFEEGRRLASVIPGARFVPLPSGTHYFPTEREVMPALVDAIVEFTGGA
jgi:pimeloyl-ACP methyl ester carboxylesterase